MAVAEKRTFLCIGTGPGIGFATAERFAREGFDTILASRTPSRLDEAARRLAALGTSSATRHVDASQPESVARLVHGVVEHHGQIDVLHYNVAAIRKASLFEQPINSYSEDLGVNIAGAMAAVRAAGEAMFSRGRGSIFLTGGHFGLKPVPDYISLSIGKAGLRALALGVFEPFKAKGVRVSVVHVSGPVTPESELAMGVGDFFWKLHEMPSSEWLPESSYP